MTDPRPGAVVVDAAGIAALVDGLAGSLADAPEATPPGTGPLLLVCVLRGGFVLTADLARALARRSVPVQVEFIAARSYASTESRGEVDLVCDVGVDLRDRDVVLVEDVVDTGVTTRFLLDHCRAARPRRLRLLALLDKPGRRRCAVRPDLVGTTLGDDFVVGYGLDLDGRWRELPGIHRLEGA